MCEQGSVQRQCSDNERKERLIEVLSQLSLEDLTLTMATGLDCKHCPVAEDKGKCYDKVVCFRSMMGWLEKS